MLARRDFALGAATVALASRADGKASPGVRVGYCALTWGDDNVKQAIADIAQVGYRGTQLRVRALKQFPSPAELKAALARAGRYVKLLLDTGHYAGRIAAGAIERHARRLVMLHIKDWRPRPAPATDGAAYEFVELGQGKLDFPPVFRALRQIRYAGWALVEMEPDSVRPDRSAREAALANKNYLGKTLGLMV